MAEIPWDNIMHDHNTNPVQYTYLDSSVSPAPTAAHNLNYTEMKGWLHPVVYGIGSDQILHNIGCIM